VVAAFSGVDLAIGVPLEPAHSTLLAMRLADRLKVDADTATQTYYACQLFYVGCRPMQNRRGLFGGDGPDMGCRAGSGRERRWRRHHRVVAPPDAGHTRARQLARGLPGSP
jgi:hypothetical protein